MVLLYLENKRGEVFLENFYCVIARDSELGPQIFIVRSSREARSSPEIFD